MSGNFQVCPKNTLNSCSEKTSWSLKTILEEKLSKKFKNGHEFFFHSFGNSCLDILNSRSSEIYRETLFGRNFS
jgi:hypothetical protein